MTQENQKNYPEQMYDLLYKANLIGEGKVIIKAKMQRGAVSRSSDGKNWEKMEMLTFDQSETSVTMIPVVNLRTGIIEGDWTLGLTKEEVEKINQSANVPIYYSNDKKEGDTPVLVMHNMELNLSNPIEKSIFNILAYNDAIALSKDEMTEDQDYYFFSPADSLKKKKEEINFKKEAILLDKNLSLEGKLQLLTLLKFEKGVYVDEQSNEEEKLFTFTELAFEIPKDILQVNAYERKETRIAIHMLINHHALVAPNGHLGAIYHPSTSASQAYGELLGATMEEAIKNFGKLENSELSRKYKQIVDGVYEGGSILDRVASKGELAASELMQQVKMQAEYQLPVKIGKTWLTKVSRPGIEAYLKSESVEFDSKARTKDLRDLAKKTFEEKDK